MRAGGPARHALGAARPSTICSNGRRGGVRTRWRCSMLPIASASRTESRAPSPTAKPTAWCLQSRDACAAWDCTRTQSSPSRWPVRWKTCSPFSSARRLHCDAASRVVAACRHHRSTQPDRPHGLDREQPHRRRRSLSARHSGCRGGLSNQVCLRLRAQYARRSGLLRRSFHSGRDRSAARVGRRAGGAARPRRPPRSRHMGHVDRWPRPGRTQPCRIDCGWARRHPRKPSSPGRESAFDPDPVFVRGNRQHHGAMASCRRHARAAPSVRSGCVPCSSRRSTPIASSCRDRSPGSSRKGAGLAWAPFRPISSPCGGRPNG